MLELDTLIPPILSRAALSTKTVKQAVWNGGPYHIQGTFDYTKSPAHIQNLRNVKLTETLGDIIQNNNRYFVTNESSATIKYLDSSRTASSAIYCAMSKYIGGRFVTMDHYKMYAEFHFDS